MRKALIEYLKKTDHKNRYFLTADVGYNILEPLQEKMKDRFINVGIAEQSMVGIASGLALGGKEVFTYTMCAFYLRAIEQIRNDICYQDVPVTMIGVGIGYEYEHLGTTHYATEDDKIIGSLRNICVRTPKNVGELELYLDYGVKKPTYLRLTKFHETTESGEYINNIKYPCCVGDLNYMKKHYGT